LLARGFESPPYESIANESAQFGSAYFSLANDPTKIGSGSARPPKPMMLQNQ